MGGIKIVYDVIISYNRCIAISTTLKHLKTERDPLDENKDTFYKSIKLYPITSSLWNKKILKLLKN